MQNMNEASAYLPELIEGMKASYTIDPQQFNHYNIKRGLRNADGTGVLAGVTGIGSVQGYQMVDGEPDPIPGKLYYRGYDVQDIVRAHMAEGTFGFEEVVYLLLLGHLPSREELDRFDMTLSAARKLPKGFIEDMILKAPSMNIMNKLSRCVLALYSFDEKADDTSMENLLRQSVELIARFPIIVANAYAAKKHYFNGDSLVIHVPDESLSVAENFLSMLRPNRKYTKLEAHILDMMLVLHAEHGGGNNSAFTCRVLSSTGTDTYGAIAGSVNSLKGPLHGGANAKVMEMYRNVRENVHDECNENEIYAYMKKILDKQANDGSGKIYGLGHAVYTISDPRTQILKEYARELFERKGRIADFKLMESIERQGLRALSERLGGRKQVCANVDMYSGLIYQMLGIPEELYTPLFAVARIAGWCAHRIEEIYSGGRIIRPAYRSMAHKQEYTTMENR
ncbi:MAG: citrate synthase [Clostridia bacterium]|nr:citrate synthase [Clostridia bacterium]